jgi:hypothetical protein
MGAEFNGFLKIGNGTWNIEAVKGKSFEQLKIEFPDVRIEILKEIHKKVGKTKSKK